MNKRRKHVHLELHHNDSQPTINPMLPFFIETGIFLTFSAIIMSVFFTNEE